MITSSGNFQIIKLDVIFEFQFLNHLKLSLCIFSIIFCIEALTSAFAFDTETTSSF